MKNIKKPALTLIGIVMVFLGLLWFIQGTAIIQMCPILCFADCECITDGSLQWELIGLAVLVAGIAVINRDKINFSLPRGRQKN